MYRYLLKLNKVFQLSDIAVFFSIGFSYYSAVHNHIRATIGKETKILSTMSFSL